MAHAVKFTLGAIPRKVTGGPGRLGRARRLVLLALTGVLGLLGPKTPPAQAAPFMYVTNTDVTFRNFFVNVVDLANTNVLVAPDPFIDSIPVAGSATGLAVHPAGTFVYVTHQVASGTVSVISTATNTVTATIPVGSFPRGVAVHPAGTFVYVANREGNTVSVINTASNRVTATVTVDTGPREVAVHPAGTFVYVTQVANTVAASGTVSVISTATNTVTATIPVGSNASSVAVHPAGTFVYVTNNEDSGVPGGTRATLSVIGTATNRVTATVPVGSVARAVAVHPAGTFVYVLHLVQTGTTVSVINTTTNAIVATPGVTGSSGSLAVHPAGTFLYASRRDPVPRGTTDVIDLATNRGASINVRLEAGGTALGNSFITPVATSPTPVARITLSGSQFRAGQSITVGVDVQNPAGNPTADLYVGVLLPDRQTLVFFSGPGAFAGTGTLANPAGFRRMQPAPGGFALSQASFFQFAFPPSGVPPGNYLIFAALAREGAFADGRIDPGDILTLDAKTFAFSP